MKRCVLGIALVGMTFTTALADTVILNETFESYADNGALFAQWGSGNGENFGLVDSSFDAAAFPQGGKGAFHAGSVVAEWIGLNAGNALHPTSTQSIVISGDIYDTGTGYKRMSIGLRGPGANLVEMGIYNTDSCDPTVCGPGDINGGTGTQSPGAAIASDPGFYQGTGYGARLQLFQSASAPLKLQPDWQYFELPTELDRGTPPNGIVNIGDIGAGWHRYTATITPESVTLEIDLFRDELKNTSRTPNVDTGIRPGTPGVDATMSFPVVTTSAGYTSLRIGGPSGNSSTAGGLIYDNLLLSLVDVTSPGNTPDFDGSGTVDAADYTIWRDNLGLTGTATQSTGDANGDLNVTAADYDLWKAAFGTSPGSGSIVAGAVVPEPAAFALAMIALASLASGRRRLS